MNYNQSSVIFVRSMILTPRTDNTQSTRRSVIQEPSLRSPEDIIYIRLPGGCWYNLPGILYSTWYQAFRATLWLRKPQGTIWE